MQWHPVELRRIARQTRSIMDEDRVKGSAIGIGGNTEQAAGHPTGEGKMDQGKGTIQNAIGGIKDALKGRP